MAHEITRVATWLYGRLTGDSVIMQSGIEGVYRNLAPSSPPEGWVCPCSAEGQDFESRWYVVFSFQGGGDTNAAGARALVNHSWLVKLVSSGMSMVDAADTVLNRVDELLEGAQAYLPPTAHSEGMRITVRGDMPYEDTEITQEGVRFDHQGRSYQVIVSPETPTEGYIGVGAAAASSGAPTEG